MTSIKTVTLPGGIRLSGYEGEYIFEKISASQAFYEQNLLDKWFPSDDMEYIYDIGANIGNHTVYFAAHSSHARIFSFEPIPENYAILARNVLDNRLEGRVRTFQLAAGEERGTASMGFKTEANFGTAAISDSDSGSMHEQRSEPGAYTVEVAAIDDLDLPTPCFIKVDVEGFELHVLKGMRKTLAKMEKGSVWVEVASENALETYDFMSELGFEVADFDLDTNNNIVWTKNNGELLCKRDIFAELLSESSKRRDNWVKLGKQISRFTYEQNKAIGLTEQLKSMSSKFSYEQNKADQLTQQLKTTAASLAKEQEAYQKTSLEKRRLQEDLEADRKKMAAMQAELDMFRNSRMIKIMRFWVWHVPAQIRRKIRRGAIRFGRWLYMKLLPHPRARLFFSKINGRLRIFKDVREIAAGPAGKSQDPDRHGNGNRRKSPKQMKVAVIVDEFSFNSFRYECNLLPLEPENWREVFEKHDIDLFFCESAWSGPDSLRRPWKGKIYASVNFPKENRGILLEILAYCKKNNIPTAFWNKEDPAHYEDRVHDFVKTALEFDHIFTTAGECVERYKREYGHKSVHLMMFATQPRLFNPVERFERTDEIIFAGSWYRQHPLRCEEMGKILDAILQSPYRLKIYDRQSDNNDPNHVFPEKYLPYINPRLSHSELDAAVKGSRYALNINTVTQSETMFARRVFELMSSNTLVISNYSKGMERLFGDAVVFMDGSAPPDLSGEAQKRERSLNSVLTHHTCRRRFERMLSDIGIAYSDSAPMVTIIYRVESVREAELSVRHFHKMQWSNKQCLLKIEENCPPEILQNIVCGFNGGAVTVSAAHYERVYGGGSTAMRDGPGYRINAGTDLNTGFLKKAMAHACYLDGRTAIMSGEEKYRFVNMPLETNMLIPEECRDGEVAAVYVI